MPDLSGHNINVFLSDSTFDTQEEYEDLRQVLLYAGMNVLDRDESIAWDLLQQADCSIHVIGNQFRLDRPTQAEEHYNRVMSYKQKNDEFKIFIWQPEQYAYASTPEQTQWTNSIRNNLYQNMFFMNQPSPIMLVEDIYSIMAAEEKTQYNLSPSDIFFIYNELDEESAANILDLLSDVVNINKLSIILNEMRDYSEIIAQQIPQSGLVVIYVKHAIQWIQPFVQQIWKKIGGLSANKKLLVIGDANNDYTQDISINIPNVEYRTIAGETIALEIKMTFDNLGI